MAWGWLRWVFAAAGGPDNLKGCLKGTGNDRRGMETSCALLTVVCPAQQMVHRTAHHLQAPLAYTAAMFNVRLGLDPPLHPDDPFPTCIAAFSL